MPRIVLFGATGYTGRLTAEAMVARGDKPVLAARNPDRLEELAQELGGDLEVQTADVSRPETVRALVEEGDVLVTTVGPFVRWGQAAAEAAIAKGAHYLDSTGEPPFIREVFEGYGPAAERAGSGMLTAFGYDFVPGNLAGALALGLAGPESRRVDTGYFFVGGSTSGGMSGGTRASMAGAVTAPGFVWRDGRVVTERGAARVRSFSFDGKRHAGISVGASDHFGLPRVWPDLREVNAYLGWFGPLSRPMQAFSAVGAAAAALPGARRLMDAAASRVKGSTGGPDAAERAKSRSHFVGIAYDAAGNQLSEVHLDGPNGYTFTADMLAWGANQAANGGLKGAGALAPVEAFGLPELRTGAAECGVTVR